MQLIGRNEALNQDINILQTEYLEFKESIRAIISADAKVSHSSDILQAIETLVDDLRTKNNEIVNYK